MGSRLNRKMSFLIVCFAVTVILIYWTPPSRFSKKPLPIGKAFGEIGGWRGDGQIPIDKEIIKGLELDDYINQSYSNGKEIVSLYVGYYLSTEKVGASHSPLVCFPGQGWILSNKKIESVQIDGRTLHFTSMIAERGGRRELIFYWFQAFDRSFPGTFFQKLYAFWVKLIHSKEDNAFVRISVPVGKQTGQEALITATTFLKVFYPIFLNYIKI